MSDNYTAWKSLRKAMPRPSLRFEDRRRKLASKQYKKEKNLLG